MKYESDNSFAGLYYTRPIILNYDDLLYQESADWTHGGQRTASGLNEIAHLKPSSKKPTI